ncbi:hypothetical protein CEP88_11820 [Roseobacter denitrificans]|uniref:Uncharacterized protein n=1 Tax=Roseobacter denitrificans (strain ATCC 33942 / OCh 114) TaxID=375451 RepID=Q16DB8_ROSDO|nr:hypothetical protein [Roseobacter denitrificans]ABG30025.1 hypothetical protein RD1_0301 [Roseobacter denitrificans OCh 114]AVL53227.1 hypothetical protein CEP88_11820 [Roseobacter denitrificans]SFF68845.1 hypothetical protein SAMN05443635_10133 [Roseobacter denitrificans OCh 114]
MTRRFIATVVSAAIAVAVIGNTPARADEALARALAAVVGIAVVGAVIQNRLEDDRKDKQANRVTHTRSGVHHSNARYRDHGIKRANPRHTNRRLLPGDCLRSFNTGYARYRVFGKTCLEQKYGATRQLPQACKVQFRTNSKNRVGYGARCLRRAGYQLARS